MNASAPFGSPGPLIDRFARSITYLRLSLTDRCDLRCTYCMPERMQFLPRADVLTLEEIYLAARAFMARGVRKIRLTGGEPLVRRDMIDLVRALGRHIGDDLDELTLTTNGTRLAEFAGDLADAGVRRINVSLDTRDPERFAALARRDMLGNVLAGIAAAREAGLAVKINTVALKGINEHEIADLVAWAHGEGYAITLIEVMPLGEVEGDRFDHYLPLDAVRHALEQRWTLVPSAARSGGPARYVDVVETGGRLGFITPLTGNFCEGCNRVRLTATGQLFMCLGGEGQVDLRAALRSDDREAALNDAFARAMGEKQERHDFAISGPGGRPRLARHMSVTGG
ncbi:GTP 3',8-cyclase MoaA [Novosphingobium sp. Fuku2-ISO-50]|uniref:GTP 3',8-cyclase MoaA n=1 Tax=Novosphingobium sp. Fuku2-ISO-50 TaxID=1739114 RepID=UPI00076C70B5|nr:GTP 3',8-cyclase MoaA [Novosphingobium sp. Fuku2-ISO-50]KUR80405.1 cyclic pyranopterin phosphate synthase MoaA [Novosphingobium sp. Fuku2-ISO-50]